MTFAMWVAATFGVAAALYLLFCMVIVIVLTFKDELPYSVEEPWFVTAQVGAVMFFFTAATVIVVALIGLGEFIHVWSS